MKTKLMVVFTLSALSFFSSTSFAEEAILLGMDAVTGGDTSAEFSDGSGQKLGDGFGFYIGYETDLEEDLLTQFSIGYSFDDPNVANGETKISRTPIEAVLLKKVGDHHFGGGIAYHLNPSYEATISGLGSANIDFDDALGYIFKYAYQLSDSAELGVKYTNIDYETANTSFDASSVGFFITGKFAQ